MTNQVEPCQNQSMGKHRCKNRQQCWEPCGELGNSEEHCVPADAATQAAIDAVMLRKGATIKPCVECVDSELIQPCEACNGGWRVKNAKS